MSLLLSLFIVTNYGLDGRGSIPDGDLVPRSRKRGAIPPLPPNAYMAYSGTNFTLLLLEKTYQLE
jgi:hypothetical protein